MTTAVTDSGKVVVLDDNGTWRFGTVAGSMLKRFSSLTIQPGIVATVKGLFSQVGVRVTDTGESFTCVQTDAGITFVAGIDDEAVDCTVSVQSLELERLAQYVKSGTLDDLEQFRIVRALFTGARGKRTVLKTPLISNAGLRRMIRGKNVTHVTLVSPDPSQEPDSTYTIFFINGENLAVPGLHGTPGRVLKVPVSEAYALQRVMYAGLKAGTAPSKWLKVAKAYMEWRSRVEVA